MANEAKNNIRLGVFVTACLMLFIVAVYYIGNQQNIFGPSYIISAEFSNVGGLRKGNSVRYAGINVGSVANIEFVNDSTLKVDMRLDEKVINVIKKDAIASIGSDGLVGNVIINITPGKGNYPPVENGDILTTYSRVETDDILKTLGNTNDNIAILSLNLIEITEKLNKGHGTLPRLIHDSTLAKQFDYTLHNLHMATGNLRQISEQLQNTVEYVNQGGGTIGYLLYDTTFVTQIEQTATRLDTYFVNQTYPILENLQESGKNLSIASEDLRKTIEKINSGEGLANALLYDTIAAENFKTILENLNEGTERFSEDMEALKHNFLFRRYFKKLEKSKSKNN